MHQDQAPKIYTHRWLVSVLSPYSRFEIDGVIRRRTSWNSFGECQSVFEIDEIGRQKESEMKESLDYYPSLRRINLKRHTLRTQYPQIKHTHTLTITTHIHKRSNH